MIILVNKSLLVLESRVQSFDMFNKCPQDMRMVFEEVLSSNFYHQTHLRTFLVQNSVLKKKLLNSFFVIIMYFFCHKNFNAAFDLCRSPNTNIPTKKIKSFHQYKLRNSVKKPKDRVSINDKVPK